MIEVNPMIIDPSIYTKADQPFVWNDNPLWLSASSDVTPGTYLVPAHSQSSMLIGGESLKCFGNICPHKRATILKGRGQLGSVLSCNIHRWTWNLDGSIRGARGFEKQCEMDLTDKSLHTWNGHVFSGSNHWMHDVSNLGPLADILDISNYQWHSSHRFSYEFDWKIFMEIFLDLYHVQSFHPDLRSVTDCKTFDWRFGENWSCQTALFNKTIPTQGWVRDLYSIYKGFGYYDSAVYGAVWLGIYPNIMLEYYPGCFVVSTVQPNGPGRCVNHLEFYYEKSLIEKMPAFADVHQKTFMRTADEDEEIGLRMQNGLAMTTGPFKAMNHPVEESGYQHFHTWLAHKAQATR